MGPHLATELGAAYHHCRNGRYLGKYVVLNHRALAGDRSPRDGNEAKSDPWHNDITRNYDCLCTA